MIAAKDEIQPLHFSKLESIQFVIGSGRFYLQAF
jgi:hypothetical protein